MCGIVCRDTLELSRKVRSVLQSVFLLRGKVDDPETLRDVHLFVLDNYVRKGRHRHQLFAFPTRHTRRADNAPTKCPLELLNSLVSMVQNADIFYDSIAN